MSSFGSGLSVYIVVLFIGSGLLLLTLENYYYKHSGAVKEKRASVLLGWLNILIGCAAGVLTRIF
ncbi:CLC_0170 family protein [Paenibacillus pinihumi]|uniref:CLC_0170 family protein n=1 Tax=Paenibacillus pinihumi TaxID=669462 RepID=UPI00040EBE18|nr:CLC_0170 family protein [Paenibacillus pinihumi]